jgi:hypothetical protein
MDPSVHSYAIWKDPRSLAHVWMCSNQKAMLKALKWILIKYGKIEVAQAQEFNKVFFYSFLSIGMSYYQEGCNLAS